MKKVCINNDWLFCKQGSEGAAIRIDLPHDAMILEQRDPNHVNGGATGFFPGGIYVYTKSFPAAELGAWNCVIAEFEGVYMNSRVFFNGEEIGGRVYGYSNFFVDLSGRILTDEPNELKVIVDNSQMPNTRWYSGSGIYRSVNLWLGNQGCIKPEGVRVKTVSYDPAVIEVSCDTFSGDAAEVVQEVFFGSECICKASGRNVRIHIPNAHLWDADSPNLYTLRSTLKKDGKALDAAENSFGIRALSWSAQRGFQVNGKTVKLRGGCVHHDHGILGACAYDKAEYRRARTLKALGFNAVRYSHNPAGKNFLDTCDRLGLYVIDESFDQWKVPQSACDYAVHFDSEWRRDVTSLVSKDYNHPCVVMYCIGNEITDTGLSHGAALCRTIASCFKELDDTRPTMIAINSMLSVLAAMKAKQAAEGEKSNMGSKEVNDLVALLPKILASITPESLEAIIGDCVKAVDIVGYNYSPNLYEGIHQLAPERVILSSETFPSRMASNWDMVVNHDYVIGDFHWTAWDYLGESGVGLPVYGATQAPFSKDYPCLTAGCGSVDLTGCAESAAYYAAVIWGAYDEPYIAVRPLDHSGEEYTFGKWRMTDSLPCWTWPGYEHKKAEIEVFSIGASAALYLNGELLERKPLAERRCAFLAEYLPGALLAISYDEAGAEVARSELVTAGEETVLHVLPEETAVYAGDILYVPVHITDGRGVIKMGMDKRIHVEVEGDCELIALGSANPVVEESYHGRSFTSWHGRVLAVVKGLRPGRAVITATTEGIACASACISVLPTEALQYDYTS